jgi:DNA-binding LytR/AlgR family response regulator
MPPWLKSIPQLIAISAGLGLIFAWLGVYGAIPDSFLVRWGFWSLTMVTGIAAATWTMPFVFQKRFHTLSVWMQVPLAALIISIPVTAVIVVVEMWAGDTKSIAETVAQYAYVVVISAILTTAGWATSVIQLARIAPAATAETVRSVPETFRDRLPVRFRTAELHAIQSEDHYLRVHTSAGSELILMRLSDAIRELAGVDGLQTHRSWWVARAGVASVQKENGKIVLKLKSGASAPVSRSFAADVRAAGWR